MSSIKVAVRCRPLFENEKAATGLDIQGRRILLDSKTYDPDYTFNPSCTQDDVVAVARPILQCVKDGLNGTIMVYGQTGTGKTYTMLGQEGADNGLVHKVIADMLDHLQTKTRDGIKCALTLSMIEIYNERLTDMLSPNGEEEVTLINGFPRSRCATTLCQISDASEAISRGLCWRHTAATLMNERSSRSHVVFIVDFEQYNEYSEQMDVAHLFLVDLAGSESLKKSQASGATATEACKINRSLLALKSVFLALSNTNEATRPTHVPYRDSKLTELLQDSIGGTARTLMIACISSVGRDIEETKSTLMYAVKARSIRNAANTEKEKLLIRLRSLETENQKIRNRLQERVSERGGYYVTKEEHEAAQRLEEEVTELRDGVAQLMRDRETSEAHQHISESQQKILRIIIEDKEEKLRQFHAVYHDALHRFEHQAGALQGLVQAAVAQSKTALQASSEETVARLEQWKQHMLVIVDTAAAAAATAADHGSAPVAAVGSCASEASPQLVVEVINMEENEELELGGSDMPLVERAGSPLLSGILTARNSQLPAPSLLPALPPATNGSRSRRSSPTPLSVPARGLASHRGSVVSMTTTTTAATGGCATAPSSQAGSPTRAPVSTNVSARAARPPRRDASSSRVAQSLFGGGSAAPKDHATATTMRHTPVDEEEPPLVGPAQTQSVVGPSSASCPASPVTGDAATVRPDLLAELDEDCRRIANRLNKSFRDFAEMCVEAAQRHVQAVQAVHSARQERSQQALAQLRRAFDEHAATLDKVERHASQDLETVQQLYTDDTRRQAQYPEPLAVTGLQQLVRGAALVTVRSAESVFPSTQPPVAVQSSLDTLVKAYQRKLKDTTVSGLLPLSANALEGTGVAAAAAGTYSLTLAAFNESDVPPTRAPSSTTTGSTQDVCAVESNEELPVSGDAAEGSPTCLKGSERGTQSRRGNSMPRSASARGRIAVDSSKSATNVAPHDVSRKPRLPLAASRGGGRENSASRLQSLPGNTAVPGTRPGEKRSRSSLLTSGGGGTLSGRQSTTDLKKRRSVSEYESDK